jgi:hypothetical protein
MQGVTPLKLSDIEGYGLSLFFILGVVLCLISIVWSGVHWISTKKNKAKRARAKRRILWSVAGLAAIFVAFFIFSVLLNIFNSRYSWVGGLPSTIADKKTQINQDQRIAYQVLYKFPPQDCFSTLKEMNEINDQIVITTEQEYHKLISGFSYSCNRDHLPNIDFNKNILLIKTTSWGCSERIDNDAYQDDKNKKIIYVTTSETYRVCHWQILYTSYEAVLLPKIPGYSFEVKVNNIPKKF